MKYILDEEEMNSLVPVKDQELRDSALESARIKILEISTYVCIHDDPDAYSNCRGCDDCPCSSINDGYEYKEWELICRKNKDYSQ